MRKYLTYSKVILYVEAWIFPAWKFKLFKIEQYFSFSDNCILFWIKIILLPLARMRIVHIFVGFPLFLKFYLDSHPLPSPKFLLPTHKWKLYKSLILLILILIIIILILLCLLFFCKTNNRLNFPSPFPSFCEV